LQGKISFSEIFLECQNEFKAMEKRLKVFFIAAKKVNFQWDLKEFNCLIFLTLWFLNLNAVVLSDLVRNSGFLNSTKPFFRNSAQQM